MRISLFFASLLFAAASIAQEPGLETARRIDRDAAIKLVKQHKAVFVDVRPKDAFEWGHIKGAVNIPLDQITVRYTEIAKGKMIITYCA